MKVVITSTGNSLNSKFDLRFGRCGWFCIYDPADKSTIFFENKSKDANGGAGTKAVEAVAEMEANRVISGDFGPKAKSLLEKFNIQMIILDEKNKSVKDIIEMIKN
ncbi:NifB/NifX family molybdenum-iron cluster-binding protein [Maribellus maritimus]|uniref:NifB/NifX family molybdenum-iron cluster-binding protein n=1 Tax=Maribellus maritimus TaxID=2870838 RepID=UPI001EEB836A|nr:NifB/NifX family molybdenum-iron cluster-binding protein [Maribellus maritimus]MCG6190868.1 dinitrogenase iron-molybdenum cofactor biosynthesis protein [Maribellus maritimus]